MRDVGISETVVNTLRCFLKSGTKFSFDNKKAYIAAATLAEDFLSIARTLKPIVEKENFDKEVTWDEV